MSTAKDVLLLLAIAGCAFMLGVLATASAYDDAYDLRPKTMCRGRN